MDWIYLDNNATTRLDPAVLAAMLPYLEEQYANPSSIHQFGQQSRHAIETARQQIASLLGSDARQIVFTSGGTEANDLAIRGTLAARPTKRHFVTTAVEHDSVLNLARHLDKEGLRVTYVGVDQQGRLDLAAFEAALGPDTALASVMHANNETGVILDIEAAGRAAAAKGVPLHVDATQTMGKLPIKLNDFPAQLVTWAAHKFHGPKGIGGLWIKRGARLRARVAGGHQERDLRPGTENVAGIVGMAEALRLALDHLQDEDVRVRGLRDHLEQAICDRMPDARVLGNRQHRLPNTSSVGFPALEAEAILMLLSNEGLCASSGSACSSGSLEPSHVLTAMGLPEALVHGAIRFSLSRFTTADEIERSLAIISSVISRLRRLSH